MYLRTRTEVFSFPFAGASRKEEPNNEFGTTPPSLIVIKFANIHYSRSTYSKRNSNHANFFRLRLVLLFFFFHLFLSPEKIVIKLRKN